MSNFQRVQEATAFRRKKKIEELQIEKLSCDTKCSCVSNILKIPDKCLERDVASEIGDIEIPVLIMKSQADSVTPQFIRREIYDAISNDKIKTIWTVPSSEHCELWLDYNREYREKVEEFLRSIK